MTILYQYPMCSTCRKARKWLDEHGIAYETRHLVDDTPNVAKLSELHQRSGLPIKKFFNTSGGSYRNGNFKDKLPHMTKEQAIEALAEDGMLIKRPILEHDHDVLVGFDENDYASMLT